MNWIRENKFLAGFIGVLIIGTGALGYLLYSAYGAYADVSDQYTQQANELNRLQSLVPYPDRDNLAKYRAEHDGLVKATYDLATNLSHMVLPVEDLSPSAFQDRLRESVSTVDTRAAQIGVKVPDKFAMDFDAYQSQPPLPAAAGPLGRQLEAIQIAMNILLDDHVDHLASFKRYPLPQESGGSQPGRGAGRPGARGGEEENLVEKYPFEIEFTASQASFQRVLNDFASSTKQFFITRTLAVKNTDPKPIAKQGDTAGVNQGAGPAPGAPAGTDTSTTGQRLKFIVGTEKVDVAMRIEIVAFNPPEKAAHGH